MGFSLQNHTHNQEILKVQKEKPVLSLATPEGKRARILVAGSGRHAIDLSAQAQSFKPEK